MMSTNKDIAFKDLQNEFEAYTALVLKQLRLLETVIENESECQLEGYITEIKKNEKTINEYEIKISESVINIIVLYTPVATELRNLISVYRVSLNVEKIGDIVINIINEIKRIRDYKTFYSFSDTIHDVLIMSISMVERALQALAAKNMDNAIWTIKNDDIVDEFHRSFVKKIVKKKLPHVKTHEEMKTFLNLMSIASNIERIADNATNIAEAAIYLSVGKDVRHKHVDLDSLS